MLRRTQQQKTKGLSGVDMEKKNNNWWVWGKQKAKTIFNLQRGTNRDLGLLIELSLRPLSYSLPHVYTPPPPPPQFSFWHLLIPRPLTPGNLLSQPFSFSFPPFMPGGSPLSIIITLSEAKKNNLNSRELIFTCRLKAVWVYKRM